MILALALVEQIITTVQLIGKHKKRIMKENCGIFQIDILKNEMAHALFSYDFAEANGEPNFTLKSIKARIEKLRFIIELLNEIANSQKIINLSVAQDPFKNYDHKIAS